jgi:hypothetical protein
VLQLAAEGHTNTEIGKRLFISPRTVEIHRANMMQKLGTRKWTGRIAQVDGDSLYINAGQKSGLNVGDKLKIFRAGKDIIDPVTKVKLGTTESPIGEAIVQQNDLGDSADLSIAAPRSGTGFRPGDIVKLAK